MTAEEICVINDLQKRGLGYKRIAALIGLPVNSVKSHCRRHKANSLSVAGPETFCRGCGRPIERIPMAKPRQFCSDACRMRYWNSHRDSVRHKAVYSFTCPHCGREFQSPGNPNRKYCSRACAANARRKGGAGSGC